MKSKNNIQGLKINILFIGVLLGVILFSGCARITEGLKCFVGISTNVLEDGRKNAISKTFNFDYATCYKKAKDMLKSIGAYIYVQDEKKKMLAVYVSETDTTPVGLFFKEVDASVTQIDFTSPSTYAKELIAKRVSNRLLGIIEKEEKKEIKPEVEAPKESPYITNRQRDQDQK